jgi:hypothetical protein
MKHIAHQAFVFVRAKRAISIAGDAGSILSAML